MLRGQRSSQRFLLTHLLQGRWRLGCMEGLTQAGEFPTRFTKRDDIFMRETQRDHFRHPSGGMIRLSGTIFSCVKHGGIFSDGILIL